jgi:hypothetical protein
MKVEANEELLIKEYLSRYGEDPIVFICKIDMGLGVIIYRVDFEKPIAINSYMESKEVFLNKKQLEEFKEEKIELRKEKIKKLMNLII